METTMTKYNKIIEAYNQCDYLVKYSTASYTIKCTNCFIYKLHNIKINCTQLFNKASNVKLLNSWKSI